MWFGGGFFISTSWRVSILMDKMFLRAFVGKIYEERRFIRRFLRALKLAVQNCLKLPFCGFKTTSLLGSACFGTVGPSIFNF